MATNAMDKILQLDDKQAIQIAGPTASGKSALAIKLAQLHNGEIINTDSMQVFDVLQVLTARPDEEETKLVAHHLYGHKNPGEDYSVAHWLEDVSDVLEDIKSRGKIPIFVGGTGLYFKALGGGLSEIPKIPENIRDKWRSKLETEGIETLYGELSDLDPETARSLKPADKQRITRALEVFEATGKPIGHFHGDPGKALINPALAKKIILMPPRPTLHQRIETRFQQMVDLGAIEEVKNFMALAVDPGHTSAKAIGLREITAYLDGEISLERAIELSVIATRQYAKRQSTWFRNQLGDDWQIISQLP